MPPKGEKVYVSYIISENIQEITAEPPLTVDDIPASSSSTTTSEPAAHLLDIQPRKKPRRSLKPSPSPTSSSSNSSSSDVDDLEVCVRCGRYGKVFECDYPNCHHLWHKECLPTAESRSSVNLPGKWYCPSKHVDVCFACQEGGGRVIICDQPTCKRVYHLNCIPSLRGVLPQKKDVFLCPHCIKERSDEIGHSCRVCGLPYSDVDNALVSCTRCNGESIHVQCFSRYGTWGDSLACFSCARKVHAIREEEEILDISLHFVDTVSPEERAQVFQIVQGSANGLLESQQISLLHACVAKRNES